MKEHRRIVATDFHQKLNLTSLLLSNECEFIQKDKILRCDGNIVK